MPDPRHRAVVRVLASVFVGLGVLTVVALTATGVVLPNCGMCHRGGAFGKATQASAHNRVACASCHVPAGLVGRVDLAFTGIGHVATRFLGSSDDLEAVTDHSCLTCHESVLADVSANNGLRIKHVNCAKGTRCVGCHSTTAHGTAGGWAETYNMDKCLHCHGSDPKMSKCDSCHAGRRVADRMTTGPWSVTHGSNWRKTHGMGDQNTCLACHPKGYCDRCHGPGLPHTAVFRAQHPETASDPKAKCFGCHKKTFCTDCHGVEMPHPTSFVKTHSSVVKTGGKTVCLKCHVDTDCSTCHIMHVHPGGAVPGPLKVKVGG